MRTIMRTRNYVVKERHPKKPEENDGYQFAVFTKEEAGYGQLAYPEWQEDSLRACFEHLQNMDEDTHKVQVVPEYRELVKQWQ